jgi:septal ring factor EnvC (AmiA/AmiB activator)
MRKTNTVVKFIAVAIVVAACGLSSGCTKRPNEDELAKLEQARSAAESAERKLADLRSERTQLEKTLEQKQQELSQHEAERDELKQKMAQ